MRRTLRTTAASLLAVALVFATPGAAHAIESWGSRTEYKGPTSGSYGKQTWDAGLDYLYGQVYAGGTLASGWCLDSLFDWKVSSGHHDARAWRTCRSTASIDSEVIDSASTIQGLQKAGTCYGPDQQTNTSASQCVNATGFLITVVNSINVAFPNNCAYHKTRNVDNTVISFSGGNPLSCAS
ncbi:hypothetical protein AB0M47_21045 [Hamadaea sp. NPDC051192]|uniref:hypothetical protein n=1 Tax=Hamadaea sp. NPDC051192 TaxID=3154940 RepID=UPI003430E9E9